MLFRRSTIILILFFSCGLVYAQEKDSNTVSQQTTQSVDTLGAIRDDGLIDEVVIYSRPILGSKFQARNRTGSAYFLSPSELAKFNYTDINRMLKSVPGVNMYEEDGFGLRPNISLRGTKAERSERISLMEDGILIAPAPYSAPAAYYFPSVARMSAVEVLKGSSQVQYGPFTTGGAINMLSTPIPTHFTGKFNASYGSFDTAKGHIMIGDRRGIFGYMVEYLRHQSKGFRRDEPDERIGFKRNDVVAKFGISTDRFSGVNHNVELKLGWANEDSDETYLGLSSEDFALRPYFRYAGADKDHLKTQHFQSVLSHILMAENGLKITTNLYYNYFFRNWYKLSDVRVGYLKEEKRSIGQVLADPETNHEYFEILTGQRDYIGEALMVRANRRKYFSRGIQSKAEHKWRLGESYLTVEGGIRYHEDGEDRFQEDDGYSMQSGEMKLFRPGDPGSQSNQVTTARAWSGYILNTWAWNNLTITAGLRYEDVVLEKRNYTKQDPRRSGRIRIETPNSARVWLPGVGVNYKIIPEVSVFTGVHRGFAPPSAVLDQKPESSTNVEAGLRIAISGLHFEVIGFNNNYQNMLGSDLTAAGGQGTMDQFNVGAALVRGVEVLLNLDPMPRHWLVRVNTQLSYTYTDTKMKNDFTSSAWGDVHAGDEIPYIFKHSFNGQLGVTSKWVDLNVGVRFNGDMRTVPGQGTMALRETIPHHTIWDATIRAKVYKGVTLTLNAINLANKAYVVSRHPSGMRAGHPRGIYGGVEVKF